MSNRQARREQSRTARTPRTNRPAPGGRPPQRTGGGPDLFSRPYLIAVTIVVVALAVVLGVMATRGSSGESSAYVTALEKAAKDLPLDKANGVKLGDDSAPIKLTQFEDFQCPFCLKYTATQEPALVEEYVKTGKMQIIYAQLPILGKGESMQAAIASLCAADQNKFWQYHNLLFLTEAKAGQADANNEKIDVGRYGNDKLKQYASDLGLDRTAFDKCFDNNSEKVALVDTQNRQAKSFGINGTPGFLINGSPIGTGTPESIEAWRKALDAFLSATPPAATGSPAAGTAATGSPAATPTR
jgi:protein-disulfide isomerase